MDAKARAAAAIAEAKAELDRALTEIDMIQTFNPTLVGLVAHSLSNYISVTSATVEMLQLTLRDSQDPDVPIWLEGIGHTAELMQHSVGRLVSLSAPRDFPLKLDQINITILMNRACDYFRKRSGTAAPQITSTRLGQVPLVWADRVALAVVADNLIGNAVRASSPHGSVQVRVTAEPGSVVCSIKDSGRGLSQDEQQAILEPGPQGPGETPQHAYAMAVTREFIRRMDGDLWVESEPDRGACFSFRLPAIE
ncbi:MAG TPA: HAMP domain-containing sensor histidine kinase [Vicinamibacterales bacterium]